jgi:hypothetical protein
MRKGFLICEKMRKYFPIYEEAVSYIWLCNCSILNFLIYGKNLIIFFISAIYFEVANKFIFILPVLSYLGRGHGHQGTL